MADENVIARRVRIRGRVQGVGFRDSLRFRAGQHGVAGWARNSSDGSVEAHLEGAEAAVACVIDWCRSGPRMARVDRVDVSSAEPRGDGGFNVR